MTSNSKLYNTKLLCKALASLDNESEISDFLEDICTIQELQELSARLTVAIMLDEGKVSREISQETGCSSATISRVRKCLSYGAGGYAKVIENLKK